MAPTYTLCAVQPVRSGTPFAILYSDMLKNGERHCDICDQAMTKGERYFTVLVPRDSVPPNADIPGSGLAVDALGNVRVDMCRQCRNGMGLSGEEIMY